MLLSANRTKASPSPHAPGCTGKAGQEGALWHTLPAPHIAVWSPKSRTWESPQQSHRDKCCWVHTCANGIECMGVKQGFCRFCLKISWSEMAGWAEPPSSPAHADPPEVAPLLRMLCRKELTSTQKTPRVKNLLLENHSISGNDRMNPIFN